MDPQIALSYGSSAFLPLHFPTFFDSIDRIGDRVGVHIHAWRWDTTRTTWIADHEDPNWVSTCVATAYSSFRDAFGGTPTLHRFGSRFMSTELMNQVRTEGSSFDLTLEPGEPPVAPGHRSGSVWRGVLPDFSAIPRVPYRPERSDFRRVGVCPGEDSFFAVHHVFSNARRSWVALLAVRQGQVQQHHCTESSQMSDFFEKSDIYA